MQFSKFYQFFGFIFFNFASVFKEFRFNILIRDDNILICDDISC